MNSCSVEHFSVEVILFLAPRPVRPFEKRMFYLYLVLYIVVSLVRLDIVRLKTNQPFVYGLFNQGHYFCHERECLSVELHELFKQLRTEVT
jgi:hypothetical protein